MQQCIGEVQADAALLKPALSECFDQYRREEVKVHGTGDYPASHSNLLGYRVIVDGADYTGGGIDSLTPLPIHVSFFG
jgi:hypothetical protein